jgi:hypothetical protein
MRIFNLSLFFLFSFVISSLLLAQDNLVEISGVYAEEIQVAGFTLNSEQSVSIEANTISPRRNYRKFNLSEAEPEDRSVGICRHIRLA